MSTICTLTARRLHPGAYDGFRAGWDPTGIAPDSLAKWTRIYHCRDLADPEVVLSFGLFDGSEAELREAQERMGRSAQVARVAGAVQAVLLDGSFEVVEMLAG
jgi:hypothetical protein